MISWIVFTWLIPPLINFTVLMNLLDSAGNKYLELLCDMSDLFLIYPSTILLSDKNISCRQSIFNSFPKNFAIFTDNMAAINSKCGIEVFIWNNSHFPHNEITVYCSNSVDHSDKPNLTISLLRGIREVVNPKFLYLPKPIEFIASGYFINDKAL